MATSPPPHMPSQSSPPVSDGILRTQRARLEATISWAHKLRETLQPLLATHGKDVHFRPSSTGVAMVGLLPARPQRGLSSIRNLQRLRANFEQMFDAHCRNVGHGRVTGEKALQSFLISEANQHGRNLLSLNHASELTDTPVTLEFITDELSLPVESGEVVCDLLALRVDGTHFRPVLIELKDSRMLTRLVAQVESYAALIDAHADLFAQLFAAMTGRSVQFDGPAEKWIVWRGAAARRDPREDELRERGIRVVAYTINDGAYSFVVGDGVSAKTGPIGA